MQNEKGPCYKSNQVDSSTPDLINLEDARGNYRFVIYSRTCDATPCPGVVRFSQDYKIKRIM